MLFSSQMSLIYQENVSAKSCQILSDLSSAKVQVAVNHNVSLFQLLRNVLEESFSLKNTEPASSKLSVSIHACFVYLSI